MPTPEEIKKLSREYAEDIFGESDYYFKEDDMCDAERDFESVVTFLSKDFVIVPKSLLKEHYEDVCEDIRDYDGKGKFGIGCADMTMCQRARGMKQMLYRLFGKSLFNEEKE